MLKLLVYSNYSSFSLMLTDNIDINNVLNDDSIDKLFHEFNINIYPFKIIRSYIWDMENHRVLVDNIEKDWIT